MGPTKVSQPDVDAESVHGGLVLVTFDPEDGSTGVPVMTSEDGPKVESELREGVEVIDTLKLVAVEPPPGIALLDKDNTVGLLIDDGVVGNVRVLVTNDGLEENKELEKLEELEENEEEVVFMNLDVLAGGAGGAGFGKLVGVTEETMGDELGELDETAMIAVDDGKGAAVRVDEAPGLVELGRSWLEEAREPSGLEALKFDEDIGGITPLTDVETPLPDVMVFTELLDGTGGIVTLAVVETEIPGVVVDTELRDNVPV
jgi:hypothetical protein